MLSFKRSFLDANVIILTNEFSRASFCTCFHNFLFFTFNILLESTANAKQFPCSSCSSETQFFLETKYKSKKMLFKDRENFFRAVFGKPHFLILQIHIMKIEIKSEATRGKRSAEKLVLCGNLYLINRNESNALNLQMVPIYNFTSESYCKLSEYVTKTSQSLRTESAFLKFVR